jgi:hypothetical protein
VDGVADQSTGEFYVGKADGAKRNLGRWSAYARNGHGDNIELRALLADDLQPGQRQVRDPEPAVGRASGPSQPPGSMARAMISRSTSLVPPPMGPRRASR